MRRSLGHLLAWLLLLSLIAVLFIPLTETGSRLVLDNAGGLPGLEVEYGGGTLAGQLEVRRLAWRNEGLALELSGVVLELSPACLWRSRVCFQQLDAQRLEITVIPGTDSPSDPPPGDDSLLEFPIPLEAQSLKLDTLLVTWEGGEWRQGNVEAEVLISGSTIAVNRILLQEARLTLREGGKSSVPTGLPEIELPLKLQVEELLLEQGSWDLYGQTGELQSLRLKGEWMRKDLQLGELGVRSPELGAWSATGGVEFSGYWPLAVEGAGSLPPIQGWPEILDRTVAVKASGNLEALAVQVDIVGRVALSSGVTLNTLDSQLPFQLQASVDWPETLALSEFLQLPEALAGTTLSAPLRLAASGDLQGQVFQLQASGDVAAYPALDLQLAGSHQPGRVEIDDLRLRDASDANTLWATGELDYGDSIHVSAFLESSGLDLSPLVDFGSGQIEGKLQLLANLRGEEWDLAVAEVDLKGEVNGLPARISGQVGIDSQLRLLASDLNADVNDTQLVLRAPGDRSHPASVEVSVDDLGIWLPGSSGKISLQAITDAGWKQMTLSGSMTGLRWQGLQVDTGEISGAYQPAQEGNFRLEVMLAEVMIEEVHLGDTKLSADGNTRSQKLSLRSAGDIAGVLELEGDLDDDGRWAGQLASTTLQTSEGNLYLREPVDVNFIRSPPQLRVAAHCWYFQQSKVCPGEALVGEEGSASVALDGELKELTAFLPEYLKLEGSLSGNFTVGWASGQPLALDGQAQAHDIVLTRHYGQEESGSAAWQRIDLKVHNGVLGLDLDISLFHEQERVAGIDLQLPADRNQPISGSLEIAKLQLAMFAPFTPEASLLQGELRGKLQLRGTMARPLADGTLYISDGQFALLGNPTEFSQMELQLDAHGDRAAVQGSALLGGGPLSFSGDLGGYPDWKLQLSLEGERHEILLPPYTQMLVSENLQLQLTPGLLDLKGDILVHEGLLEHEQLPEGSVGLSDDVVEVDDSGNVIYQAVPFDASINVGLVVPDKFELVGDVVNATLGGDLQLRQNPRQPLQVFGNLNVVGGELRAYQQRLRIQRGTIAFAGTPDNPDLDVRAQRKISTENIIVGLHLQGTLKQPRLEVFSDPPMSHGEAMSYLVRGRAPDSGTGGEGVAMALTVGTGLVNQSALVEELNRIPGVSQLEFGAEGSTEEDTAATVGGYLGERLYLSYGLGIYEPIYVLTARLYLKTRLWLEVVSRLENSVDLYYSFDIK